MKHAQSILRVGVLFVVALVAGPALADTPLTPAGWYGVGFLGGPRVCDAINPDGWCVAWHWDLKDSDYEKAQRSRASRRAMAQRVREQDSETNFRPAQPKVFIVKGDVLVEEPAANPDKAPSAP